MSVGCSIGEGASLGVRVCAVCAQRIILYPSYIDSTQTVAEGRVLSKEQGETRSRLWQGHARGAFSFSAPTTCSLGHSRPSFWSRCAPCSCGHPRCVGDAPVLPAAGLAVSDRGARDETHARSLDAHTTRSPWNPAHYKSQLPSRICAAMTTQEKHYPRAWWIRCRIRVALKNPDGSPVNPEIPTSEPQHAHTHTHTHTQIRCSRTSTRPCTLTTHPVLTGQAQNTRTHAHTHKYTNTLCAHEYTPVHAHDTPRINKKAAFVAAHGHTHTHTHARTLARTHRRTQRYRLGEVSMPSRVRARACVCVCVCTQSVCS